MLRCCNATVRLLSPAFLLAFIFFWVDRCAWRAPQQHAFYSSIHQLHSTHSPSPPRFAHATQSHKQEQACLHLLQLLISPHSCPLAPPNRSD